MSNKLDVDDFLKKFSPSYHEKIRPFFQSTEAEEIYAYLKKRRPEGYMVLPKSPKTFSIFQEVPLDKIKMFVLGQEPFSSYVGNIPIASGIALDCRSTNKLQPSLEYFYYGLENNFPTMEILQEPSLEKYTKQGVFLSNACLTVEKNAIATHIKLKKEEFKTKNLWAAFWKYAWENVFNELPVGTPVVLLGKAAQELKAYVDPFRFSILETQHPSWAARNFDKEWNADHAFLKANNILEDRLGEGSSIEWGKPKDDGQLPF